MKLRGMVFLLPILLIIFSAGLLFAARTELISRAPDGSVGDGRSEDPSISSNARYVVYQSTAPNLSRLKTTGYADIFLYDRMSKETTLISTTPAEESNGSSSDPEISDDGNIIAFSSVATNLVDDDTEGFRDIFVYNRTTDTISRISVSSNGTAGDGDSDFPDVSGNGRYVVFQSDATNLVNGDTNTVSDIFRHDLTTGNTIRVSLDFLDAQVVDHPSEDPVISESGRYIAFVTRAGLVPCDDNNQTDVFVRDLVDNTTTHVSRTQYGCVPNGRSNHPSISADGRFVGFASYATDLIVTEDENGFPDVFLRDRENETTEIISVATNEAQGDARSVGYGGNISADGSYVTFASPASNFVTATDAYYADGNEGWDVFVRNRSTGSTTRESVGSYWEQGIGDDPNAINTTVISADGKYVVFDSISSNLVPGDNNDHFDVFIRDYLWQGPLITSISPESGDFNGGTTLIINGSGFDAGAAVTIDGSPALNVNVSSSSRIICVTPPHAIGAVELRVTNPDGTTWLYPIGRGLFGGYIYRSMALPFLLLLR